VTDVKDNGQLDEATWKARLDAGGNELGIDLDQSQLDLLWRYGVMLRERNAHVNLTSIVSPEGILTLHMLDSLSVAPYLGDAQRLIDVGTGGGFPGIPLAVAFPKRHSFRSRGDCRAGHPQRAGDRGARRRFRSREGIRCGDPARSQLAG
jgi:16S rRNA (guanine527-N7)-methyltransferase